MRKVHCVASSRLRFLIEVALVRSSLYAIARAARDLHATEVVLGVSEKVHAEEQLEQFALAWGSVVSETDGEEPKLTVRIMGPQVEMKYEMS